MQSEQYVTREKNGETERKTEKQKKKKKNCLRQR